MNRPTSALVTALVALAATAASSSLAAEPLKVNTPAISQSTTYAELIARSSNAVRDYVLAHSPSGTRLANFWVFPTADANTVFVRYTVGDPTTEHLVLVEMDGTRIASLRDLTLAATPTQIIEADAGS
jgi:hypothetical protein